MMRRSLACLTVAAVAVLAAPVTVRAHHTTVTCIDPETSTWQITNSQARTAMNFDAQPVAVTGTIAGGGSGTVVYAGSSLTVHGWWFNGVENTSVGYGDCTPTPTTTSTTSPSTSMSTTTSSTLPTSTTEAPPSTTTLAPSTTAAVSSTSTTVPPAGTSPSTTSTIAASPSTVTPTSTVCGLFSNSPDCPGATVDAPPVRVDYPPVPVDVPEASVTPPPQLVELPATGTNLNLALFAVGILLAGAFCAIVARRTS